MEDWHRIIKDTKRYGNIDPDMPDRITCNGTLEQAEELARRLSNRNAGCDFCYRIAEDDE